MLRPEETFAPSPASRWLVSTEWLSEHLHDRNLAVVDGSFFLPAQQRNARAEYLEGHIPGAVFFDIETVADHSTELPHMLPGPAQFGEVAGTLGISESDTIVVYDSVGLYSAPRVWWTFRIFGAKKVCILDGGLPRWKAEGRALEKGEAKPTAKKFNAEMNVGAVAMLADARMAIVDDSVQIVDARPADRFAGKAPEPRPGLRSGHMPRSFNVPYARLVDSSSGRFLPPREMARVFSEAGIDVASLPREVVVYCNGGVTCTIPLSALRLLGRDDVAVFDGSWNEWGNDARRPIRSGPTP